MNLQENRGVKLWFCIITGVIFSAAFVQASPYLSVATDAGVSVATYGGSYLEFQYDNTVTQTAVSGPLAQDTGSVETLNYLAGQGTARAKAQADYGVLRAWAGATGCAPTIIDVGGTPTTCIAGGNASGTAAFSDALTISSPGVSGSGTLAFLIHVDGSLTGILAHPGVAAGAGWEIRLNDDYNHSVISWDYSTNSGREGGDFTLELPFVFGQSTSFSLSLTASASGYYYNTLSLADYFNTVTVTGLSVKDSVGNTLDTFTAVSGSGYDYTIPEPATMVLLGLGGLLLGRKRRA